MQNFIEQARQNQIFHDEIHEKFPDRFFDWKITVLFYIAIHLVKAMAAQKKVRIGASHEDIANSIRPTQPGTFNRPSMPISQSAYNNYHSLYTYSRTARYEGITTDIETTNLLRQDMHARSLEMLRQFKLYMESRGISIA